MSIVQDPNTQYDRVIKKALQRVIETDAFREIVSEELHHEFRMPSREDRFAVYSLIHTRLGL